jgi:hypothetical protein
MYVFEAWAGERASLENAVAREKAEKEKISRSCHELRVEVLSEYKIGDHPCERVSVCVYLPDPLTPRALTSFPHTSGQTFAADN